MTELEKMLTFSFFVIKNNQVMPMGLGLGKSMKEINKISYAVMRDLYNTIDFDREFEMYKEGKRAFLLKARKKNDIK